MKRVVSFELIVGRFEEVSVHVVRIRVGMVSVVFAIRITGEVVPVWSIIVFVCRASSDLVLFAQVEVGWSTA